MRRTKIKLELMGSALLVLLFTIGNLGRQLPPSTAKPDADLAAWSGSLFVIQGNVVKKLDSRLETVKSVELPGSLPLLPPEPNIGAPKAASPEKTAAMELQLKQTAGLPPAIGSNRIAADQQYVYVFHEGTIIVFDHNLIHVKSKILD